MKILAVVLFLVLAGCISSALKPQVGKDIREAMISLGPPVNAFDMADGSRAFQFRAGGGATIVATTATTSGSAVSSGSSTWFGGQSIGFGVGVPVEGCIVTLLARWDIELSAWIVISYRLPSAVVC